MEQWRGWLVVGMVMCLGLLVEAQGLTNTLPNLEGKVAFVGSDYNVYTRDLASGTTYPVTDDASRQRHYQWPTWSTDGRLAFFCCDLQVASNLDASAYISPDGEAEARLAFEGVGETVIYAAWSPVNCDTQTNCRDLAILVNDLQLGILNITLLRDSVNPSVNTIALGSPFYYSWSSDGKNLLFHRNGQSVETYSLDSTQITRIAPSSGAFQAPFWSPVDERLLFSTGRLDNHVLSTPNPVVTDLAGLVAFAWSPNGQYIAYRIGFRNEFGAVVVVDSQTGQIVSQSETGAIAFFWSPDSQRIAYVMSNPSRNFSTEAPTRQLISNPSQQTQGLTWLTLDIATGLNRAHTTFIPTSEMVYLLLYFDQFAQSHRIWSPDSRYITYSETVNVQPAIQSVSILNVIEPNAVPITIGEGVFSVWSF